MFQRLRSLIIKEFLAVLRDPRSRMSLIGPPLIQLFIFSYAATLDVQNVRVGVLDRDPGRWSSEITQQIAASPTFRELVPLQSMEEVSAAIDTQEVIAVVHIGQAFSSDIAAGKPSDIQIILDGRRPNAAQIVNGYLSEIIAGSGAYASIPPPARIVERAWFNENLDYQWFTVPSLIGIIALVGSLTITALSVARERELGTYDQLMVSPLRVREILIGKMIPPLVIGLVQTTFFLLAAVYIFRVPLAGSVFLLYIALVFYLASIIGVGLFISSLSMTQQQAFLGSFIFTAPAILLSGFAAPIDNMPEWLQVISLANPVRYFLDIVIGVYLKGLPAGEVLSLTLPLVIISIITLMTSAYMFRARME